MNLEKYDEFYSFYIGLIFGKIVNHFIYKGLIKDENYKVLNQYYERGLYWLTEHHKNGTLELKGGENIYNNYRWLSKRLKKISNMKVYKKCLKGAK